MLITEDTSPNSVPPECAGQVSQQQKGKLSTWAITAHGPRSMVALDKGSNIVSRSDSECVLLTVGARSPASRLSSRLRSTAVFPSPMTLDEINFEQSRSIGNAC